VIAGGREKKGMRLVGRKKHSITEEPEKKTTSCTKQKKKLI
jgi:hypothetical protein